MARTEINEEMLESVNGGSIVLSPDLKTCGHNCNNQYVINDLNAMLQYVNANRYSMNEPTMLANMKSLGYIS